MEPRSQSIRRRSADHRRIAACTALALCAALFAVPPSFAGEAPPGPFGIYSAYFAGSTGYINIPNHPDLNPTTAITLEAWIRTDFNHTFALDPCMTIAGKGYITNYFFGFCQKQLISWVGGKSVESPQIELPEDEWVHVAMTSNGTRRRHYINGSLVTDVPETGSLTPNADPFQIARDADWAAQFSGSIDEVRLWNRALSTEEIRDYSRFGLEKAVPGLVAIWNSGASDVFDVHDGVTVGSVGFGNEVFGTCTSTSSRLCLDGRFTVEVEWVTQSDSGQATAVPPNSTDTGLFWFFAPDNWEVMVKVLNVCGALNDRVWVFIAASTDQGYRINVRDALTGREVEYSKPVGPPAPAITDTNALDVCNAV